MYRSHGGYHVESPGSTAGAVNYELAPFCHDDVGLIVKVTPLCHCTLRQVDMYTHLNQKQ
jgi:hypothetical protein